MKKLYTTGLCLSVALLLEARMASAQAPGSVNTYGGSLSTVAVASGGTQADISETLYVGPGNYQVDGIWEIYSKYIVIDPAAVITGTGTIRFLNPITAGGVASPNLVDGNAGTNAIKVNMELQNISGMQLLNTDFTPDLTVAGFTNNSAAATLYAGAGFNLAVDGANVFLGTSIPGDLRLDSNAVISGYSPARMIVTGNSILSHVVKDPYTGSFTFPIGIAAGDYTPAQITNATANSMHISVQDYVASAAAEQTAITGNGINRTWNIYAGNASGSSTIALQHNDNTNQSAFNDGSHFVTRNGTAPNNTGDNPSLSSWQSNTLGAGTTGNLSSTGTVSGSSIRSRTYTDFATAASATTAYYSKSSEPLIPLPVTLTSFTGNADKCTVTLFWETATERNLDHFDMEYSDNGHEFSTIGNITGNNILQKNQYSFATQQADGIGMYRLSMVDKDGSTQKSQIVTVHTQCQDNHADWFVFPAPADAGHEVMVQINADKNIDNARLVVVNILGGKLMDSRLPVTSGIARHPLPVAHWPKGTYIVTLFDGKGNRIGKASKLVIR